MLVRSNRGRGATARETIALAVTAALAAGCAGDALPDENGRLDAAPDVATDAAQRDAPRVTDAAADLDAPSPDAADALAPDAELDGAADAPGSFDAGPATDAPTDPDVAVATDTGTGPAPDPRGLLLDGRNPMPCADPAVVSENDAKQTYYIYCTSMSHVWKTSDWLHFTDERAATQFTLTGLSANGQHVGAWWAPGLVYAPGAHLYVMWVSVPAARATDGTDGWSARSLAVLTATTPTGPWVYRDTAIEAGTGERYIDPFLFRDQNGRHYVFWKQYGGAVSSSIMGSPVDGAWEHVTGTRVEIMNGYGGAGTWEDNVRENPAIDVDAAGRYHFLFSGGHWRDDTYATGHALSSCGPLCVSGTGSWHMQGSGDRGIFQVVRANGLAAFADGGPGGAVFQDDDAHYIVYAAAARSAQGDSRRYLMRSRVAWQNAAPYVDTAGHHPEGY